MKINLKNLVWIQIAIIFIIRFIINITQINYLAYICDFLVLVMIVLIFNHYKNNKIPLVLVYIIVEILYWIIGFILEERSNASLLFYMMREFVRFYVMFLAVQICFLKKDYQKLFKIFDIVLFIHFLLVLFQIYILKIAVGDSVGGIFGVQYGYGNISSHNLLLIAFLITMYNYLGNNEKVILSLFKIVVIICIGMMTEMKSIIFEAVCIVALFIILSKKIKVKFLILLLIMITTGIYFINYLQEYFNFDILNIESIDTYLNSGYAGNTAGIGRTDGYEKIYKLGFDNDKLRLIIGYGLGSAISPYTISLYGSINLEYFTYAKLFYDIGIIGSILYFGFFTIVIYEAMKTKKKDEMLSIFAIVTSIICIYLNFYGSSMESDFTGYCMYILLAIPFVLKKEKQN